MSSSEDIVLLDLPKSKDESIRVAICEFKGFQYVDVRLFYKHAQRGSGPTAKGVSIRPSLLRPIIDALTAAEAALTVKADA